LNFDRMTRKTLPSMNKAKPSADHVLDDLGHYLAKAAKSLFEYLRLALRPAPQAEVAAGRNEGAGPRASRGRPARRGASAYPWDRILPVAQRLLRDRPTKLWRSGEFSKAIRAAGVHLKKVTGLHFGLLPRLRKIGAIAEDGKGGFSAKPAAGAARRAGRAGKPARKAKAGPATPGKRRAGKPSRAAAPRKPAGQGGMEQLIAASQKILDADPFRVWRAGDFLKALRDSGIALPSWKGVHFKLLPKLRAAQLIEREGPGFRASVRARPDSAKGSSK